MPWNNNEEPPKTEDLVIFLGPDGYYVGYFMEIEGMMRFVDAPSGDYYDPRNVRSWNYLQDVIHESLRLQHIKTIINEGEVCV